MPIYGSKPDYWRDGKPIHQISYCAFLDILGFSQRILESAQKDNEDGLLQEFHAIFRSKLDRIKADSIDTLLQFKTFSDNVLLAFPQFSPDMESEFAFILWSLREYQFEMAINGFFIRGGLSVGPLFISEDNVYGRALVEAHELESTKASYPIVILSDDAMALVNSHLNYYGKGKSPQYKDILVDENGRYFINYLNECLIEDDALEIDAVSLRRHKEWIEKNLEEFKDTERILAKYSWLASYHNFFCGLVEDVLGYEPGLLVGGPVPEIKFGRIQ